MAQCPKCNTQVTVDFGITSCSGCDSILFVDVSGNVQLEGAQAVAPMATSMAPVEMPNFSEGPTAPMPSLPPLPEPPPEIALNIPAKPFAKNDMSEVAAFGNSEASLGKEGAYLYDVLVWNIDSKEIREQLREALRDKRFVWDVDRIMSSINKGALRINKINSVKAAVLVSRIKNLPVGLSWEQNLITDTSS